MYTFVKLLTNGEFCWIYMSDNISQILSGRSLDSELAATLFHAFMSSGVDYYNAVYGGTPRI